MPRGQIFQSLPGQPWIWVNVKKMAPHSGCIVRKANDFTWLRAKKGCIRPQMTVWWIEVDGQKETSPNILSLKNSPLRNIIQLHCIFPLFGHLIIYLPNATSRVCSLHLCWKYKKEKIIRKDGLPSHQAEEIIVIILIYFLPVFLLWIFM